MADVAMYVLGCFYWAEQNKTWSQHGLMVRPISLYWKVVRGGDGAMTQ